MVTKVEKTVYVDSEGKEFDNELEAKLSEYRISLASHCATNPPLYCDPVFQDEIEIREKRFHKAVSALPLLHIHAFANYFNALIELVESE